MDQSTKKVIDYEKTVTMLRTVKKVGKPITISAAMKLTGTDPESFYHHVRRTMEEDYAANRPLLASFIVGHNNLPIPQYFQIAQELGYQIGNQKSFWQAQLQKLGVPNVSNIIRGLNVQGKGGNKTSNGNGFQGRDRNPRQINTDSFSEETRSFYGNALTQAHGDDWTSPDQGGRSRGRRGGRGRNRSTSPTSSIIS